MRKEAQLFVLFIVISFSAPSLLSLQAQNSSWTSNGPDGGSVSCLTISESNSDILYAGTNSGLYKTENGGERWSRTNFPDYYPITVIQVHRDNPDLVLVGTYQKGLYRTEDGGKSWKYMGLWDQSINSLNRDPNDPDVLYFGTGEYLRNFDEEFIAIYKIDSLWKKGAYLIGWGNWDECGWSQVNKIVVDPDSSNWIYAAGSSSGYCSGFGSILISQDGGDSWDDKKIGTYSSDAASNIAVIKNSQGEKSIIAITGTGLTSLDVKLMKSPDMGESWEEVVIPYQGDINPKVLFVQQHNPGIVIIGSKDPGKPLWLYTEETGEWDYIAGTGLPYFISPSCVETTSGDDSSWYLSSRYGGIYKSTAYEGRWDRMNTGINNCVVNDFVVDPDNPSDVYAAIYESLKLVHSSDGGNTWEIQPSNYVASFDVLSLDPNHPSTFWAAKSYPSTGWYYLYKGEGYGQNWTGPYDFINSTPSSNRTEITDILVKPGDSNTIFLSSQPWKMSTGLSGFGAVARSTNGGSSWSNYSYSGSCLAMDPDDLDKVYVGKERSGQVFLFEFDGNSTSLSNVEPDGGIGNVSDITFDHQGNYYVATDEGLWRASDAGWDSLSCLSDYITSLAADHSRTPSVIYAGSEYDGVFLSDDRGESWMPYNNGLENKEIIKLEIAGQMLYASTNNSGIWSRPLPETISPPYLTHQSGNMEMSVFQNGSIGHTSPNWSYGDGLAYNGNIDPLFYGGFFLGSSDLGVANGIFGGYFMNNDFRNIAPITGFTSVPGQWDQITTCAFDDLSSLTPLGISVIQHSFSNNGDDYFILRYTLESSAGPLDGLYAGMFADWDVGGGEFYENNLGGFDLSRNLAYQYLVDGDPDPSYYGIVALEGLSGTRIRNQCHSLYVRDSSLVWMSTINEIEPEEPDDLKMWIGSGPYDIDDNESLEVCFAIVAGASLSELQANADLAAQKYLELPDFTSTKENILLGFSLEQNAPNPFSEHTIISYSIPYSCDVSIDVYNAQGTKVRAILEKGQMAGYHSIEFGRNGLDNGVYFFNMKTDGFFQTRMMVLY